MFPGLILGTKARVSEKGSPGRGRLSAKKSRKRLKHDLDFEEEMNKEICSRKTAKQVRGRYAAATQFRG
jgi:hypothetical protein